MHLGKFPQSLASFQEGLKLAEDPANEKNLWWVVKNMRDGHRGRIAAIANLHHTLGHLMGATGNVEQQILNYKIAQPLAIEIGDKGLQGLIMLNLGAVYNRLNRLDSALMFEQNAERLMNGPGGLKKYLGNVYRNIGSIYLKKQNKELALKYFYQGISTSQRQNNFADLASGYSDLTDYYLAEKQKDSSIFYARKRLELSKAMGPRDLGPAYEAMYKSYALVGNTDSAYKYQGLALVAVDSTYKATTKSLTDFQKLSFQSQLHAQDLEKEKEAIKTRIRTYVLLAAIVIFMLIAGIFYRNNRQKQKANHLLHEQKEEIEAQRDSLDEALQELKNTQTQLVQREKMASLGELTAGIAHEIQNPLNFVNNFSEVNTELLEELKAESAKPKAERDEQLETELIDNLIENEKKINMHGKRADFIVKGMLEHSRTSTGEKQPTDINVLCDEFFKLSYHGLRAKDKNFNAELVTHFDGKLPQINIAQQDIGRVLINLIGNAFYAVNQKAKTAGPDYKPTVEVSTSQQNGSVIISVKDNGNGIPEAIRDKIMQPFFTTKPTGEGTGLGLSLSYDIVVKGHSGKINVDSKEGEGSEFTIQLPVS
ncbi:MAG: GHKL domain-containing protein [Bacteroidetes bacterium]|nr:GHKL domain-containing protein [Bacteroidota bacterium]